MQRLLAQNEQRGTTLSLSHTQQRAQSLMNQKEREELARGTTLENSSYINERYQADS